MVDRHLPDHPGDAVLFDDAVGHDVTAAVLARGHTAVAALWSEMGVAAVRLLHERLADPGSPARHVVLPATVRVAPRRRGTLVLSAVEPPGVLRPR